MVFPTPFFSPIHLNTQITRQYLKSYFPTIEIKIELRIHSLETIIIIIIISGHAKKLNLGICSFQNV